VRLVQERALKIFKEIRLNAKVTQLKPLPEGIEVRMTIGGEEKREIYDRVLVSIGRTPNGQDLVSRGQESGWTEGFYSSRCASANRGTGYLRHRRCYGGMMLAHKASKDAKVAVDVILGEVAAGKGALIPAVVFTDPELAWCGLTESEAKAKNIPFRS